MDDEETKEDERDEDELTEAEFDDPPSADAIVYFRDARDFLVNYREVLDQVDDDDVKSAVNLVAIECCRRMCRVMRNDLGLEPGETEIGHG